MVLGKKKVDATRGAIIPLIISFVIPLILTTLIQQLFNAVDIAVLGNMADTTAVASVGATTTIIHLIVDAFVGISSGAKIVLSRLFGKKDNQELRRTIDTSLIVAFVFGILITLVGFFFAPVFLRLTKCPVDCFEGAMLYIRIYVLAAPAILIYNYGAATLTSSGDSRRPLYYAIISGLLNMVLNIVLCFILTEKLVKKLLLVLGVQFIKSNCSKLGKAGSESAYFLSLTYYCKIYSFSVRTLVLIPNFIFSC
jgi:Na+-driven multidrug efflux pump